MKTFARLLIAVVAACVLLCRCEEPAITETARFLVTDATGETPESIEVGSQGVTGYKLRVISGAYWRLEVSEGSEWITASPSYASKGVREVVIDVAPNEELSPRSGRLDFNSSLGSVSVRIIQERGEEPVEEPDIIIPVEPEAPVADLLDVVFNADGTAYDCSGSEMNVEFVEGFSSVNYYNEIYKRYVSHYSHKISTSVSSGYYRIDYTDDPDFKAALADGHTLEVVFRMDVRPNGEEIKPFSSMGAGGTGFLVTAASRGTDITFLPNVSTEGKSSYKWTQSGVIPDPGRYYHVVGVWNKSEGMSYVYVDGVLKGQTVAYGDMVFPTEGNTWFCVGGDPGGNAAQCAFNGDVVVARIYDDPLTAEDVERLYGQVRNDTQSELIGFDDLVYLPDASVTKGCWFHCYSDKFHNGDVLILESLTDTDTSHECETVYEYGSLKLRIPDALTGGRYLLILKRGTDRVPLGYVSFNMVDKLPERRNTKIIAHRGYHPGDIPENSIASFEAAQKLGVYGSELDVYITTDGVVVLYHDTTFRGTRDHPDNAALAGKRPDSCTYEEIKDYKLCNGERIPTLDDYLEQAVKYPDTKLILEIKPHDSAEKNMRVATACYEAIREKNLQHQVEYISFNYDICLKILELDPDAVVLYLNGNKKPADLFKDGLSGIDYNYKSLTEETIAAAHELGMAVNVWTLNTASLMMEFIEKGVDFITTDEVELGLSLVENKFVS